MYELVSLSVSKDRNGKSGGTNVPIREITHLESDDYRVIVHTEDNHYFYVATLTFLEDFLNSSGYRFRMADRGCLINVDSIAFVDMDLMLAYFEDAPTKKSKKCTLGKDKFARILKEFTQLEDRCNSRIINKKRLFGFGR